MNYEEEDASNFKAVQALAGDNPSSHKPLSKNP
jgi:hypothetical protein